MPKEGDEPTDEETRALNSRKSKLKILSRQFYWSLEERSKPKKKKEEKINI
jgi:hypothetical protein